MKLPRVILADDHTVLTEALRAFLQSSCEIVATASDGRELVRAALSLNPDLVVIDVAMPPLNGLDAARQLREKNPEIKIIFLTMNEDPDIANEAMHLGSSGFLLKSSAGSELLHAIQQALKGKRYVSERIMRAMEESFIRGNGPRAQGKAPTPREREVIQLLAEGKPMKEVAHILNVSERTVAFHKYRAMERLRLKSTAELIQYAVKTGMVAA